MLFLNKIFESTSKVKKGVEVGHSGKAFLGKKVENIFFHTLRT